MRRIALSLAIAAGLVGATVVPMTVQAGVFDHIWSSSSPPTLTDIARAIDRIQEALVNQGTVSVKQPDVWSQGRMTRFRKEFEDQMVTELGTFKVNLAARVARTDSASLRSETALAASLTPTSSAVSPTEFQLKTQAAMDAERNAAASLLTDSKFKPGVDTPTPPANFTFLNATTPTANTAAPGTAGMVAQTPLALGLEPNVVNDQKADYITHLQRLRRINLGDDTADTAGYGLYLLRVPVSIQPGDKTKKGFGALVTLTMNHDFGPRYLPSTYRNLVINDLVDQLGPVIHELIRNGHAKQYHDGIQERYNEASQQFKRLHPEVAPNLNPRTTPVAPLGSQNFGEAVASQLRDAVDSTQSLNPTEKATAYRDAENAGERAENLNRAAANTLTKINPTILTVSRTGQRSFAMAPTDVRRIYVPQNLLNLAYSAQEALDMVGVPGVPPPDPNTVRMTEVRSFLRRELEGAYDVMEGRQRQEVSMLSDVEYIESLADSVFGRKYEGPKGAWTDSDRELNEFYNQYESFTHRLPGNMRFRPLGVLCWAIAVEAGLLNRQLQEDMRQTRGPDGWVAPAEVQSMNFYMPEPAPEVEETFQQYVRARWPMITFALEPVVDQQNIEEAFSRRRDLQLAIAFALASGRISFRQAINFQRQLQYEAQTIDLNQTVAAFANGNDTFGWRISPRFQLPPEESNVRAVTNLLLRGGPGPNYQIANSKIEPGMREMTAVVVMPSFVRGLRVDVASDWYRLSDPDERKVHTARSVELGRKINEAREGLDLACQCAKYRPEDVNRLRAKLHQLETMLPLQTSFVKVPYENTLGGFALFTQGATALVPELNGYEGINYADIDKGCDLLIYGKNFSLYETALVVGGKNVPRSGSQLQLKDAAGAVTYTLVTSMDPPRDTNGNILLLKSDGTAVTATPPLKDAGAYDILSREIIRLRIPPGVAKSRRADGSFVVEVFVSTPNGISNRLQIPLPPAPQPPASQPAARFSPFSSHPILAVADSALNVRLSSNAGNPPTIELKPFEARARLRIIPNGAVGSTTKAIVRFLFEPTENTKPMAEVSILGVEYDEGTKGYTLNGTQLTELAKSILAQLKTGGVTPTSNTVLRTRRIDVQPLPAAGDDTEYPPVIPTSNQITVNFEIVFATASRSTSAGATAVAQASRSARDPMAQRTALAAARAGLSALPPLPGESTSTRDAAVVPTQLSTVTQPVVVTPSPAPAVVTPAPAVVTNPPAAATPSSTDTGRLVFAIPGGTVEVGGQGNGVATLPPVGGTLQLPGRVRVQRPGANDVVDVPGTVTVPLPGSAAAAATTPPVTPSMPVVNVSVPVTNVARQPKQGSGLFHRRAPISPQNPTRPPLMERLLNRP